MAKIQIKGYREQLDISDSIAKELMKDKRHLSETKQIKDSMAEFRLRNGVKISCKYTDIGPIEMMDTGNYEIKTSGFEPLPEGYKDIGGGYYSVPSNLTFIHPKTGEVMPAGDYQFFDIYNIYGLRTKYSYLKKNEAYKAQAQAF